MDLETAKLLGTGGAQIILAICLVAVSTALYLAVKALIQSFLDRIAENKVMLKQGSDDTNLVTAALKEMKTTLDLALAALKARS